MEVDAATGRPKHVAQPLAGLSEVLAPSGGSVVREATSVGASFGRLERVQSKPPMSEINMTPLIDVMLVLLVIFMITAPLLASSIKLDLPKTSAAQPNEAPKFITLVVDKLGLTYVNDKPVTASELARQLTQMAAQNPETEVQLRADQAVPYGRVVEVMGAAQKAGLNRIGFVADSTK